MAVSITVVFLATASCGKWFGCLSGKSCAAQKDVENAATADLFVNVVNMSLDAFKGVMSELGLSRVQQDDVISDVQATAQSLTSQLALTNGQTYSGTMLENLSAMFQDLLQHTISKITEVAPNVDASQIMNACAQFMNDMIANAGLVGILESLPVEEQANLDKDAATGKLDWEVFRAPLERVTMSEFSGKVESDQMGAAFEKMKRRPGEEPHPPAEVVGYQPSPAEKASGGGRAQGLCQAHPGDVGRGPRNSQAEASSDSIPLPGPGCNNVRIDKKVAFCLFARPDAMKICSDTSIGDGASGAAVTSAKFWVDNVEQTFSSFEANKKYDCTLATDREALGKAITAAIQSKAPQCQVQPPPPPGARHGDSPMPR